MKLTTLGKFALGSSVGLVVLMAAPMAASAAPAGINVPCTDQAALVGAINAANTAGGGTINLTRGCHYLLGPADNLGNGNGLPVVTTRITVNGNGATIDGTKSVRVLEVDGPAGNLSLQNVTITGGSADIGGGIENLGGTVTLNHTQVTGNTATQAGGGIASATFDPASVAKLTLNSSAVTGNSQTADPTIPMSLGGGGIVNVLGTVTLNSSQVNNNTAQGFVGGGIASGDYLNFSGTTSFLTLNGSQVDGNTAPNAGGGGIQNLLGTATLNSSQVDGNTSLNGGGISSGPGPGSVPGSGNGAPPAPATSQLVLNKSEVNRNTAIAPVPESGGEEGAPPIAAGGIANGGNAILNHSEVNHNTAKFTSGAGIVNHGTMTLNKSEVNGNTAAGSGLAASGGGIINAQGPPGTPPTTLTVNNSQVNNNRAGGEGGGIANGTSSPGPPPLFGGTVTLNHSQVTGNTAPHGGGIFNFHGTVTLSKTSVTGNQVDNCEPTGTIPGCTG
jgi:predicted outer membrane repeat protein